MESMIRHPITDSKSILISVVTWACLQITQGAGLGIERARPIHNRFHGPERRFSRRAGDLVRSSREQRATSKPFFMIFRQTALFPDSESSYQPVQCIIRCESPDIQGMQRPLLPFLIALQAEPFNRVLHVSCRAQVAAPRRSSVASNSEQEASP